ncbi:MAG TPA: Eco57I restriction-modification methylase domain-containing protein [Herpetosiphonaceae bacterium]|nr:Eco57I restriction-modification methylase domain-containing protein [Herpetosiphonaceae bacterium]
MLSGIQLPMSMTSTPSREKNGAIYTKPWVVELILDLAGYVPEADLATSFAIEPAAGDGAFLVPMAHRLIASARRHQQSFDTYAQALCAYELDETSASIARNALVRALTQMDVEAEAADQLASRWVRTGDFLIDAPALPPANFVIGNPPYIRLEDIDPIVATVYRQVYRTMIGRADIYVAFFEAALRQLLPGAVCAFICADRWMLNQYGAELRRLVTREYNVEAVVEMHNADAFEHDVSAYPAITIIRRGEQGPVVVAAASPAAASAGPSLAQTLRTTQDGSTNGIRLPGVTAARVDSWFMDADPWPRVSPERLALLKQLEQRFYPLESTGTSTKVGIGVATGLDDVFITTNPPSLIEQDRLLPLAMASDTRNGHLEWSGHYLIDPWTEDGLVNLENYPGLAAYFAQHRERLGQRNCARRQTPNWYRTIDRVNHTLTTKRKLYIPDIKNAIHPVLDDGQTYPHHNLYFVQSDGWDPEVLGGLLMSAIGQFFVECYGVRMRGGYLRFQAQYLRRIRVPRPQDVGERQVAGLRHAFRQRNVALASRLAQDIYQINLFPLEARIGP